MQTIDSVDESPKSAHNAAGRSRASKEQPAVGSGGKGSYKIQIQLSDKQRARLYYLRDATEVESATQVVRDALKVYELIVDKVVLGDSRLLFEDEESGSTIEVLI